MENNSSHPTYSPNFPELHGNRIQLMSRMQDSFSPYELISVIHQRCRVREQDEINRALKNLLRNITLQECEKGNIPPHNKDNGTHS